MACYEASDSSSGSESFNSSREPGFHYSASEEYIPLDVYTACSIGLFEHVQALIEQPDVDLNKRNRNGTGWTPLMYSVSTGHDTTSNLLLDNADVDVDVKSGDAGVTALMLAAGCGSESMAFFLLQAGAELESKDHRGWTAIFYAANAGHQDLVKFLLENNADPNTRELKMGNTILMMSAAEGHELIVHTLLQSGVDVGVKSYGGETARSLALLNGHMKIVSMLDSCRLWPSAAALRSEANLTIDHILPGIRALGAGDSSSSDEMNVLHQQFKQQRGGGPPIPSVLDGPKEFASKLKAIDTTVSNRSVTSPIHSHEYDSTESSSKEDSSEDEEEEEEDAFGVTIKSSSSSLSSSRDERPQQGVAGRSGVDQEQLCAAVSLARRGPFANLKTLLESLKLEKYLAIFEEQDIDLHVFLTLSDEDLKEIGMKLMGPRRKMTAAIARWHNQAQPLTSDIEQAYADRLEVDLSEMATKIQQMLVQIELLEKRLREEKEVRGLAEQCLAEQDQRAGQAAVLIKATSQFSQSVKTSHNQLRLCSEQMMKCARSNDEGTGGNGLMKNGDGDGEGQGTSRTSAVGVLASQLAFQVQEMGRPFSQLQAHLAQLEQHYGSAKPL